MTPLASFEREQDLAREWGSEFEDLGLVGHLNPASGFGPWDRAEALIQHLSSDDTQTPALVGDRCEPVCYKK